VADESHVRESLSRIHTILRSHPLDGDGLKLMIICAIVMTYTEANRKAIYNWIATHPEEWKAVRQRANKNYYLKHRETILETRRRQREQEKVKVIKT
jgi:hypothetical protein